MPVLILDPWLAKQVKDDRNRTRKEFNDEVWEGVYVVPPLANNQHQNLGYRLAKAIDEATGETATDMIFAGCNVSDREEDWEHNYRCPDVAAFLSGNNAKDCGTHWCGGPDFGVEILSPGDRAREKRPFYAAIGVRELLIVDRDPWQLELYRLAKGVMEEVGRCSLDQPSTLASAVLPVTFRLIHGGDRPQIELAHTSNGRRWLI